MCSVAHVKAKKEKEEEVWLCNDDIVDDIYMIDREELVLKFVDQRSFITRVWLH